MSRKHHMLLRLKLGLGTALGAVLLLAGTSHAQSPKPDPGKTKPDPGKTKPSEKDKGDKKPGPTAQQQQRPGPSPSAGAPRTVEEEMEFEPEEVQKSGPPSKTMDRAKKLYDKQDYYSASIEFDKVIKGNEDSEANKHRAEFFMGKTLYHLRYYSASLNYFDAIVQKGPSHKYHRRTLQWLAALAEVLPESAGILKKIGQYSQQDLEDPGLEQVRPHLYYLLGRYFYQAGQLEQAVTLFRKVPKDSEYYVVSKYMEAVCLVLVPKTREAADALREILVIAAEEDLRKKYKKVDLRDFQDRANLTIARVFYQNGQMDLAIKYFEKLPQDAPDWLDSLFEASWAYYLRKTNSKALGNIHTLNAPYFENEFFPESLILKSQIYFNYCRYDRALEAVAEFQRDYPSVRDELRRMVKMNPDDNSSFYGYVKKLRGGTAGLPERTQLMAASVLQDKTLLKTFSYVDELDREMKQYEQADKGWKTTRIAGEVLQSLTLQKSLAEDTAGSLARERLARLEKELTELKAQAGDVKVSILEARIGNKKAELAGQEVSGSHPAEAIIVDDEHQTWDFNGEYWKDELGFYRYRISSKCAIKKGP
jgi:tetratricopeptide (TPR) repeat protein